MSDNFLKKQFEVTLNDSAKYQGSGDNEVLSTPRLIAYMENVAKKMIPKNSVGFVMEIKHLAPTPIGSLISIECTLEKNDDKKYEFSIIAKDCVEIIATARHIRVLVNKNKFQEKVNQKLLPM